LGENMELALIILFIVAGTVMVTREKKAEKNS
jgi:hypothetical protein